jgi:energy-coupling factor transporter ATP-binding protein EcfA2
MVMPTEVSPVAALRAGLHALAEVVDRADFRLPGDDRAERRQLAAEVRWTIREYLIPRLGDLGAPLVAVVIGSTGSGKSTLVNSLAQKRISEPGALRPTTRVPVVWCHATQEARYRTGFLSGYGDDGLRPIRVVGDDHHLLEGMTIVDSPDFDSVVALHRQMADDLLAVADVCVFVTSAQRYADAVPWEFLTRAHERGVPLVFVVNRIPPTKAGLVDDYRRRLLEGGFHLEDRFFEIAEQPVDVQTGALPAGEIADLAGTLTELARPDTRGSVLADSLHGALVDVSRRLAALAAHVDAEAAQGAALTAIVDRSYEQQLLEITDAVESGALIKREVVGRWQEYLGTGELLRMLDEGAAWVRGWVRRLFGGRNPVPVVQGDARSELKEVLVRRADLAATASASAWDLDDGGRHLLRSADGSLWRHGADTPRRAEEAVEEWLAGLASLIDMAGSSKRRRAVIASYGVNAAAVVLLLGVFLQTGGLTGAEVGVAAGAAAAQQKLLEHIFGSAAARSMVEQARTRLTEVASSVILGDSQRFHDHLGRHVMPREVADDLRSAMAEVGTLAGIIDGD